MNVSFAHSFVSNVKLNGESIDPSFPSKCQRGSGRVVVVLISTKAAVPLSKSMQTRAKSSQSRVHTFPRNCANTRTGLAGNIKRHS